MPPTPDRHLVDFDAGGHAVHTRSMTLAVVQADAARWRVEADLLDLRKCGFVPMVDDLQTAGIIHHMQIRADVDSATGRLERLETAQPRVAVEPCEVSRGECCRDPADRLQVMVGRAFDAEFTRELGRVFGGARGCSHLLTLFQLVASAVSEARRAEAAAFGPEAAPRGVGERLFRRAVYLDGVVRSDDRMELAVQLSDFLRRRGQPQGNPIERLALQSEVRVHATVDLEKLSLSNLRAAERERGIATLPTAEWRDRSAELASLDGRLIIPGLGRSVLDLFGQAEDDRRMLDASLQLAPGFVQCIAAVLDRYFGRTVESGADADAPPASSIAGIGGAANSCYMWREEGPLLAVRRVVTPRRDGS